jgi:hypothetical protein
MGGKCSPEKKRAAAKRYALAHPDLVRERTKRYRAANKERVRMWNHKAQPVRRKKYPDQTHAYNAIYRNIRSGKLVRSPFCQMCLQSEQGPKGIESHHYAGYDREHWIDVVWLCHACHMEVEGKHNQWKRAA